MSEAGPQVNGLASPTGKYIDHIDPDDPEYIKNLQRPAEVKEDLQQMENRSRVKVILNSQAFKEELEQVVEEQLRNGPFPTSLIALQQITDLLLPHSKGGLGSLARASAVIPINDLRGVESQNFAKGERLLRCKLAALYRLVDLCGWSHGIYNHISARVSSESEHFLLNPFGLTYSEVTASTLIKVDVNGDIVDPGSTHLGPYKAGFLVHGAIHQARPDIRCIVHLHTPAAVAVSALKCGLIPMSQEALLCGNISYHDFQGISMDAEERDKLARNLGVHNKVLILRNRGVLSCGETVEEAFHYTFNVMAACEAQVKAIPLGLDNIVLPSEEVREQAHKTASQGSVDPKERKWKTGELEFEALMRTLDNSGYRTGYAYKMPLVKQERKERSNSEVEIPPSSSSFTYIFDGDYVHSKYASPLQAAKDRQKIAFKAGWLTTPNAYKKTEIDEIGTTTPKKITKWVSEGDSPGKPGVAPIKIENPNQFAPQGDNPKEYREKQKSIKKDYYEEKVTAGPQSKILEGITWDEAQKAKDGQLSGAGDQLIVVGAASKGIIQRDHQHNAVVYRQYYAANPFENMSEAEIAQYQSEVQRKERGEPVEEEIQLPPVEIEIPTIQQPQEPQTERQETEALHIDVADTVVEPARPEWDTNGLPERVTSPQPSTGHHIPHMEKLLAHTADKVVHTFYSDIPYDQKQNLEHETLTGTDPLLAHPQLTNLVCDQVIHKNLYTCLEEHISNNAPTVDANCGSDENFIDNNNSSDLYNHISSIEDIRNSENISWSRRFEAERAETSSFEDDFVRIQLNPMQLYHGRCESGVMKVRFSVQSIVRRIIGSEHSRGGDGTIEEVCSSISEPFIEHFPSREQCFEQSGGLHAYINKVNVKRSWRRVRQPTVHSGQSVQPHSAASKPELPKSGSRVSGNDSLGFSNQCRSELNISPDSSHEINGDNLDKTDYTNSVNLGIDCAGSPINIIIDTGQIIRLNTRQEETGKQTPNYIHASGGEGRKSGELIKDTPASSSKMLQSDKPARDSEVAQNNNTSIQSFGAGRSDKSWNKDTMLLPVQSHDGVLEEDIKYADEELEEDFDSAKKQLEENLKPDEVEAQINTTVQTTDNKKRLLDRRQMPPPPLPPLPKSKNSKFQKRSLKQKKKQICPPLSPVKEEFGGTVEEMEEMEAILEEADDSFEQLLISGEDDLLISPTTDQDINNRRLAVTNFVGAAPMAVEDDFDSQVTNPSSRHTNILIPPAVITGHGQVNQNYPTFADNDVSLNLSRVGQEHDFSETSYVIPDDTPRCSSDEQLESDSTDSIESQGESDDEYSEDEDKSTNPLKCSPSLIPLSYPEIKFTPETSFTNSVFLDTLTRTDHITTTVVEDLNKNSNFDQSGLEKETIERIPQSEKGRFNESVEKCESEVMEVNPRQTASIASAIPPTKVSGTNQWCTPSETIQISHDDFIPLRNTETYIDVTTPSEKTETNIDDIIPSKKTETIIDVTILPKKTETNVDDIMLSKKIETNINVTIPSKKSETNIDVTIPSKKSETNIDVTIPSKKSETNIDVTIPSKKSETNIDVTIPSKKSETNIDVTIMSKKTETNVDDTTLSKKGEKRETNYDVTIPSEKTETNIDDTIMSKKTETNIDDTILSKKTETNVDDTLLLKKTETNIDDTILSKKTETNIDDTILSKKTETNVDDTFLLKKTETNIDDTISMKKVDLNVSNSVILKMTPTNTGDIYTKNEAHKVKHTNMLNVDEGPVQTSSPKMGRARSKESPFKPYLLKLGKSEETLLDIMPMEGQNTQIVAKSQEQIENTADVECVNLPLSRSKSLGPHHVNRKNQKQLSTKPKETLIDDFLDSGSPGKECFQSPSAVLDKYNLMKHSERMELSSARSIFKPSIIRSDPVIGDVMPPLPDTTEVPSVSDSEGQPIAEDYNQSPSSTRAPAGRRLIVASSDCSVPKQKWVPKQKRVRRRRGWNPDDEPENVCSIDPARGESDKHRENRRPVEDSQRFNGRLVENEGNRSESQSNIGIIRGRNNVQARRNEEAQTVNERRQKYRNEADKTEDGRGSKNEQDMNERRNSINEDRDDRTHKTDKQREKGYTHGKENEQRAADVETRIDINVEPRKYSGYRSPKSSDRNHGLSSILSKSEDSDKVIETLKETHEDRKSRFAENQEWSGDRFEQSSVGRCDDVLSTPSYLSRGKLKQQQVIAETEYSYKNAGNLTWRNGDVDRDRTRIRDEVGGSRRDKREMPIKHDKIKTTEREKITKDDEVKIKRDEVEKTRRDEREETGRDETEDMRKYYREKAREEKIRDEREDMGEQRETRRDKREKTRRDDAEDIRGDSIDKIRKVDKRDEKEKARRDKREKIRRDEREDARRDDGEEIGEVKRDNWNKKRDEAKRDNGDRIIGDEREHTRRDKKENTRRYDRDRMRKDEKDRNRSDQYKEKEKDQHRHRTKYYNENETNAYEPRKWHMDDDTFDKNQNSEPIRNAYQNTRGHRDNITGILENQDKQTTEPEKHAHTRNDISRNRRDKLNHRLGENDEHFNKYSDTNLSEVTASAASQHLTTDAEKISEKGLSPIDLFLNSNRMEINPESSPRLQRRRGGAIAYPDDRVKRKDKRQDSGIMKITKGGNSLQDSNQSSVDEKFKKGREVRKHSESDSTQDEENRVVDKSDNFVAKSSWESALPSSELIENSSTNITGYTSHLDKPPHGRLGSLIDEPSHFTHPHERLGSLIDEPSYSIHPHRRLSMKNQHSLEGADITILPLPESEPILKADSCLYTKERSRSTEEEHTKDNTEKNKNENKKDGRFSKVRRNVKEVMTNISDKENIEDIDETLNYSNIANMSDDIDIVLTSSSQQHGLINVNKKTEKKESDRDLHEKNPSRKRIKAEKEIIKVSKDENGKVEERRRHRGVVERREKSSSDEDENKSRKLDVHEDCRDKLSQPEAVIKTRRLGDRCLPLRRIRNSSGKEDTADDGGRGFGRRKKGDRTVSPKEVSKSGAGDEEQLHPARRDEGKRNIDNRIGKDFKNPELNSVNISSYAHDNDDNAVSESIVGVQEKQKYAGFIKRTGRGVSKSHPMKSVSLSDIGSGQGQQNEKYEDSLTESEKSRLTMSASPNDTSSEDDIQDFDSLIHDNPIEVNMDSSNVEKPAGAKKGILNLFSCVGGRSASTTKRAGKHAKKRPTAYYEEGEKRKIKKLSRQKDKEEKKLYYFEEPDKDHEHSHGIKQSVRDSDDDIYEDNTQEPSPMPIVKPYQLLPSIPRSERYQKRTSIQSSKSVATYVDPAEALESLEGKVTSSDEEDDDDSSRRWKDRRLAHHREKPLYSKANERESSFFSSFGKANITSSNTKSAISKHKHSKQPEPENAATVVDMNDSEQIARKNSEESLEVHSAEDSDKSTEMKPAHLLFENDMQVQVGSDVHILPRQSDSPESVKSYIIPHVPEIITNVNSKPHEMPEPTLGDFEEDLSPPKFTETKDSEEHQDISITVSPPADLERFDSSDEYPSFRLNSSAPAHFSLEDQHQISGQRHALRPAHGQLNSFSEAHQFDSSYDQSMSFDTADLLYRRNQRTVSFDDGYHPLQRHISETSVGAESTSSRPRSASSVSNPLIYEPWRVKADKKKRSLSVSETVYAKGVARPVRTRSVGEICNSTVASSVARRRAKARHSSDITSRMYQPRQHNRSHSSLGNTSFGSVHPIRQRSFSGFDRSVRSDDSFTAVTVKRSESDRQSSQSTQKQHLNEDKPIAPLKSDTLKSTDSASGGETLEERSSKEGSPTKEHLSPTKEKKKKKKFHIPSFSKKKSKESKESAA